MLSKEEQMVNRLFDSKQNGEGEEVTFKKQALRQFLIAAGMVVVVLGIGTLVFSLGKLNLRKNESSNSKVRWKSGKVGFHRCSVFLRCHLFDSGIWRYHSKD